LNKFLVVTSVPVQETSAEKKVLFYLVFFCVVHKLNALEVTTVLTVDLSDDKFFQTVWIREKSIILDYLKLLFFCFLTDSDVASLENLGTKAGFTEILL